MRQEVEFRRGIEYAAPHYISPVLAQGSARENGLRLLDVYAALRGAQPDGLPLSATNRACVLLLPGVYDLPSGSLVLDTEFVDIVGVGAPEQVILTSSGTTVAKTANDALISCVTLRTTAVTVGTPTTSSPAAFYPSSGYAAEVLRDVILEQTTTTGVLTRRGIAYAGTYAVTLKAPSGSNVYAFDGAISGRFDVFAEFTNLVLGYFLGGSDYSCTHTYENVVIRALSSTGEMRVFGHSWAGFGEYLSLRISNSSNDPAGTLYCVARPLGASGDSKVSTSGGPNSVGAQRALPLAELEAGTIYAFAVIAEPEHDPLATLAATCSRFQAEVLRFKFSVSLYALAASRMNTGETIVSVEAETIINTLVIDKVTTTLGGDLAICCAVIGTTNTSGASPSHFAPTCSVGEVQVPNPSRLTSLNVVWFAGSINGECRFSGYLGPMEPKPNESVFLLLASAVDSQMQIVDDTARIVGFPIPIPILGDCEGTFEECVFRGNASFAAIRSAIGGLNLIRCTLLNGGNANCVTTQELSNQFIQSRHNAYDTLTPFGANVTNLIATPYDVLDTDVTY